MIWTPLLKSIITIYFLCVLSLVYSLKSRLIVCFTLALCLQSYGHKCNPMHPRFALASNLVVGQQTISWMNVFCPTLLLSILDLDTLNVYWHIGKRDCANCSPFVTNFTIIRYLGDVPFAFFIKHKNFMPYCFECLYITKIKILAN